MVYNTHEVIAKEDMPWYSIKAGQRVTVYRELKGWGDKVFLKIRWGNRARRFIELDSKSFIRPNNYRPEKGLAAE